MSTAASGGLYFSSLALAIDYDFVSRQPFYQYASHYFTKSSFTLQTQITHHHQHFCDNSRNKIGSSTSNVSGLNSADGTRIASALALNFATNTARLLHHHNDSTCQPYCLTFALLHDLHHCSIDFIFLLLRLQPSITCTHCCLTTVEHFKSIVAA